MGNKSSSTLVSIHDNLYSRRNDKDISHGEETLLQLHDIVDCVEYCATDVVKLNSKDVKLLSSIASLLANEFCRQHTTPTTEIMVACKLRAVAAIQRLLRIPSVSRNSLESCSMGLVNCLIPHNTELLSLSLNCICTGLLAIDDDGLKFAVLLRLEKILYYEKMLEIMDKITEKDKDEDKATILLLPAVLTFAQHLVWLLGNSFLESVSVAVTVNVKAFQRRLAASILKHQETIFKLFRHKENPVRFAVTVLLLQIFNTQDRKQCAILQESARNSGLLLWTLERVAELSLDTGKNDKVPSHHSDSESIVAEGEDAVLQDLQNHGPGSTGWKFHHPPVEGIELSITEAEVASKESALDSVRLLLTLLCLGDKTNEAGVFRALPESFSAFLSLRPSHDITVVEESENLGLTPDASRVSNSSSDPNSSIEVAVPVLASRSSQSISIGTQNSALSSIPRLKRLFQEKRKGFSSSGKAIMSPDSPPNSPVFDSTITTTAILSDHGANVRVNYAAKMGVHDKGSWHVLFAVLCEEFENARLVWNESTLKHLSDCLKSSSKHLDTQRSVSYQHWDIRSIDITYPLYSTPQYLCIRGAFLPQLIDELEAQGRSCFLDDPHGTLWAILDRTTVEVERVVVMISRLLRESEMKNKSGVIEVYSNSRGNGDGNNCKNNESDNYYEKNENVNNDNDNNCMKNFLICLKAMQLLLARYHPELHRVTPIYSLSGILRKGVAAISTVSRLSFGVRRKYSDSQLGPEFPTVDTELKLNSGENDNHDNEIEEIEMIEELEDNIFLWINTTLSVLQNRLSGPISRDDWNDFVSAGGADSLCVLLTSTFSNVDIPEVRGFIDRNEGKVQNQSISSWEVQQHSQGEKQTSESEGSENLGENLEKSDSLPSQYNQIKTRRTKEKEDELLVLSSQLLQNLALSSGSKYATSFASPEGLDQLSLAMWLLSKRIQEGYTYKAEIKRGIASAKDYGSRFSTDSLSVSALSSLISVVQKVADISRGIFNDDDHLKLLFFVTPDDTRTPTRGQGQGQGKQQGNSNRTVSDVLPLIERWMLLIRVIVRSSIIVKNVQDTDDSTDCVGITTEGSLTVSSAKLLKDLIALVDSGYTFLSLGQTQSLPITPRRFLGTSTGTFSSVDQNTSYALSLMNEKAEQVSLPRTTSDSDRDISSDNEKRISAFIEYKKMYSELCSAIPEHLIILCRNLSSNAFISLFNSEISIVSPEIVWSPSIRLECLKYIKEDLSGWCCFEESNDSTKIQIPPGHYPPSRFIGILSPHRERYPPRFPSLQHEPEVMGVYLRLFLTSRLDSFLIPLDAKAFALALSREIQTCYEEKKKYNDNNDNDNDNDNNNKISYNDENENSDEQVKKKGDLPEEARTITDAITHTDNEVASVFISSTARYSSLLHLCVCHLLEYWSYELSIGIWCEFLGPILLSNLRMCSRELRRLSVSSSYYSSSSNSLSTSPPSSSSSTPALSSSSTSLSSSRKDESVSVDKRRIELIQSCTSCLLAFSRYLRANGTFLPYQAIGLTLINRNDNIDIIGSPSSLNKEKECIVLEALGPGCSQLLQASGPVLCDIVFESLNTISNNLNMGQCNVDETDEYILGDSVYKSSVSALNAATALLATISLLLGEGAHIERVRLREIMSRQDEILPNALLILNEVLKDKKTNNENIEPVISSTLSVSDKNSANLQQTNDVSKIVSATSIITSPTSPSTPSNVLTETSERLEISRLALRDDNKRLLAALVSCCQNNIAERAPKATLCAICALHLLLGMESDDDSDPESYSIFSMFRSPDRKEDYLIDIFHHLGLPNILLQTATMQLDSHTASTSMSDCTVVNGEYSLKDGVLISLKAKTDRWGTHPLFTTDRFIQSNTAPVQFLPSSRLRSLSAEDREMLMETRPIQSVPTVISSILEESESILVVDFKSEKNTNSNADSKKNRNKNTNKNDGNRRMENKVLSLRGTIARECAELIRLIAICPSINRSDNIPKSLSSGTLPVLPASLTNDAITVSNKSFPVNITDVLISKLNKPIGPSLEQLLSASMLFIMMTDVSLFLNILPTKVDIWRPLVVWNASMRKDLLDVLFTENTIYAASLQHFHHTEKVSLSLSSSSSECRSRSKMPSVQVSSGDSVSSTMVPNSCERTVESSSNHSIPLGSSRATLHGHLTGECSIDNVYIRFLIPPVLSDTEDQHSQIYWTEGYRDDIGVRDLVRFVESLQTSISSSKLVLEHILRTGAVQSTGSGTSSQLIILRAHLALKEKVLTQMLAHHDELGYAYADLYLDTFSG